MSGIENNLPEITSLLEKLISTPSLSRNEGAAAILIRAFLTDKKIDYHHKQYNTWAYNQNYDPSKPTILLNSHIDTVKPVAGWTTDPHLPINDGKKIIGLGSNDAGAALVGLLGAFLFYYEKEIPFNLLFAATAEEEVSGKDGIACLEELTLACSFAIIGEPTGMQMATSEKGLMVIDGIVKGKSGHAAREEGINAIYLAMEDIMWFRNHNFSKVSLQLGPVKSTVTIISAGSQHNVIPDECRYTVDVRTTPEYKTDELLEIIREQVHAEITPRSTRLQPSALPTGHILEKAAQELAIPTFGSATLSDQALLQIPSVKIGPGLSERSHTAGEFIYLREIENGLNTYISLLDKIFTLSEQL